MHRYTADGLHQYGKNTTPLCPQRWIFISRSLTEISARRFIDDGINRVIYDGQRLHQPSITMVVTSYTTYGIQPKVDDPTSTAFSDICKMTQWHPLTYAKTLPMASSDISKDGHRNGYEVLPCTAPKVKRRIMAWHSAHARKKKENMILNSRKSQPPRHQ
uniref:Uncharacterized protein n=1 Tax=Oryza brachyantha TaxID=4533 RepID=J3L5Y6_ORYBR